MIGLTLPTTLFLHFIVFERRCCYEEMMLLLDNSELKRRLKADRKAKEKAEKSAAATATLATTAISEPTLSVNDSDDIDANVICLDFLLYIIGTVQ